MENAGGDKICHSRPKTREDPLLPFSPHHADWKLDFLVKELKKFGVGIAGIQETKWFGKEC